jgi:hypothetical protein
MFEILVNGIPRTYRDTEEMAIDARRVLKDQDKSAVITIINDDTRQWMILADHRSPVGPWQDPAGGPLRIVS